MERLTIAPRARGLTLIELLITLVLIGTVLLTASSLLSTFHKFYYEFGQNQGGLAEVSLGVLEEIAGRVMRANRVTVSDTAKGAGAKIDIWVDEAGTPSNYADDTVYTYEWYSNALRYQVNGSAPKDTASNISFFKCAIGGSEVNKVSISISVSPQGSNQYNFETTVVARGLSSES